MGANGSGKTTMLKHLYNALIPMKKTVYINGKELEKYSQNEIAQNLSVMKQENNSDFDYKVIDIVLMGRLPYKKSFEDYSSFDYEMSMNNLEKLGMKEFCNRNYNSLSGGEKQRVLIARALTQNTEIMISTREALQATLNQTKSDAKRNTKLAEKNVLAMVDAQHSQTKVHELKKQIEALNANIALARLPTRENQITASSNR